MTLPQRSVALAMVAVSMLLATPSEAQTRAAAQPDDALGGEPPQRFAPCIFKIGDDLWDVSRENRAAVPEWNSPYGLYGNRIEAGPAALAFTGHGGVLIHQSPLAFSPRSLVARRDGGLAMGSVTMDGGTFGLEFNLWRVNPLTLRPGQPRIKGTPRWVQGVVDQAGKTYDNFVDVVLAEQRGDIRAVVGTFNYIRADEEDKFTILMLRVDESTPRLAVPCIKIGLGARPRLVGDEARGWWLGVTGQPKWSPSDRGAAVLRFSRDLETWTDPVVVANGTIFRNYDIAMLGDTLWLLGFTAEAAPQRPGPEPRVTPIVPDPARLPGEVWMHADRGFDRAGLRLYSFDGTTWTEHGLANLPPLDPLPAGRDESARMETSVRLLEHRGELLVVPTYTYSENRGLPPIRRVADMLTGVTRRIEPAEPGPPLHMPIVPPPQPVTPPAPAVR